MHNVGLIETIRTRQGRFPWLPRHLARLNASMSALQLQASPQQVLPMVEAAGGAGDRVVRVEVRNGKMELNTRQVTVVERPRVVISSVPHVPYRYKTTDRDPFGRALAYARRGGADDALLVTKDGQVAEGTTWNLFWWEGERLCTPSADLGILPGIGRARVMELAGADEVVAPVAALEGRSAFLVNAVRGVVEIGTLEGRAVPSDPRTAELSAAFWPD